MQNKINKIVEGWLGKDIFYRSTFLDKVARISGWQKESEYRGIEKGHNQSLEDLRSRIPELTTLILEELKKDSTHETKKLLDGFAHPKDCGECNLK
jgi:hypothetical protein